MIVLHQPRLQNQLQHRLRLRHDGYPSEYQSSACLRVERHPMAAISTPIASVATGSAQVIPNEAPTRANSTSVSDSASEPLSRASAPSPGLPDSSAPFSAVRARKRFPMRRWLAFERCLLY